MPNRSQTQQNLHDLGRAITRIANDPNLSNPFDGPLCPPPDGVAPRNSGPPYDDGHGHLIGTEIKRDHPLYADDPPKHDPSHDSRPLARDIPWSPSEVEGGVLGTVRGAKKYYPTRQNLLTAHEESWLRSAKPVLANSAGTTISKAAFLEILPHIPFARARYVATATGDIPKFECLDYSQAFKAFMVALGVYPTGQVYDFNGEHSYSNLLVFDEEASKYVILVIEPQGNIIVPRAFPGRHYTGTGEVWYY